MFEKCVSAISLNVLCGLLIILLINTTYIAEKVARWRSGHRRATELLAITAGEGKPRVSLRIRLPDRTVTAEIASKSLRERKRRFARLAQTIAC